MATLRELVAQRLIAGAQQGLIRNLDPAAIYDADTADNPDVVNDIFLIIRWGEERRGIGPVSRRQLLLFGFGPKGDTDPVDAMVRDAAAFLKDTEQTEIEGGWLTQIHDDQFKRGSDALAGGWEATIVPYRLIAVASGR